MAIILNVQTILDDNADFLPMTSRQVFYQLVAHYAYPKTERDVAKLSNYLTRARRAQMIPFSAFRDDGFEVSTPYEHTSFEAFLDGLKRRVDGFQLERQSYQETLTMIWTETVGMVPQIAKVAKEYGVSVRSGGGAAWCGRDTRHG